jgi:hypothetical protein
MNCTTTKASLLAALILGFSVQMVPAAAYFYDVDSQTGSGPIQLVGAIKTYAGGTWTFTGSAFNSSTSATFSNLEFLVQFLYQASPTGQAYSYAYPSLATWSGDGNTFTIPAPSGTLALPSDSDAPLSWTEPQGTATLPTGVQIPYITVSGSLGPLGTSAPFTITGNSTLDNSHDLVLVGTFVSTTPLPEPSTLVLAGLGLLAIWFVARRRTAAPVAA